jgi:PTS system nitrogen regulatory IIA component
MNLKKVLSPKTVTTQLKGSNKEEIINSLIDLAMSTGKVHDRKVALDSVLTREKKMSTGMKHGIGIPHGKTEAVDELVACLGISEEEVDFEALDGKPCRIFVMTLSPVNKSGPHIQFLAQISQLLNSEELRKKLLKTKNEEEILDLLAG